MISEFYANKNILLTGVTGFVGKVILEKILRDLPDINHIYLVIRRKNGLAADARMGELQQSPIFERLRSERSDFDAFFESKVTLVGGDLSLNKLGMSPGTWQFLIDTIDITISCAAAVSFNEPLHSALPLNVVGPLQLLEIASASDRTIAFLHISTAYVGCNKRGFIEESFHSVSSDPEGLLHTLLNTPHDELVAATPSIIKGFPNTYTFSKCLCEQIMLARRRATLPTVFIRPTIIGASFHEPVPGWIDSVSAAASLYLSAALGVVRMVEGSPTNIGDQIPVDYCANFFLGVLPFCTDASKVHLYHYGTSEKNPVTWSSVVDQIIAAVKQNPPHTNFGEISFLFRSSWVYQMELYGKYIIPAKVIKAYSMIQPQYEDTAKKMDKLARQVYLVTSSFRYFTLNQWIFEMSAYDDVMEDARRSLSPAEMAAFFPDIVDLDWTAYLNTFVYGLFRYILKEDLRLQTSESFDSSLMMSSYGNNLAQQLTTDAQFALGPLDWKVAASTNATASSVVIKQRVLDSPRVREAIQKLSMENGVSTGSLKAQAEQMLDRIAADMRPGAMRFFAYLLRAVWGQIYSGIVLDEKGLEKAKRASHKGSILFIPTHRSYVDFLILSYALFAMGLPIPHIAAGEDFLHIFLVNHLLRYSGAFFMRRSFANDALYKAVFGEYVKQQITAGHPVEFFVEGTRSRSGKTLLPKMGLLGVTVDAFVENEDLEMFVVPVSITYEKLLEGPLYTNEMLGKKKIKESLGGIFKASSILNVNFGRIDLRFGDPLALSSFCADFVAQSESPSADWRGFLREDSSVRKQLVSALGFRIVCDLNQYLVTMPTALVGALLLTYRGGISYSALVSKADWLIDEIVGRGGKTATGSVKHAITLLGRLVNENGNGVVEPAINGPDKVHCITLSWYRNQVIHHFVTDAIVATAAAALWEREGRVPLEGLWDKVQKLRSLMKREFIYTDDLTSRAVFDAKVAGLIEKGTFVSEGQTIRPGDQDVMLFLCSLLWPLIDAYYITALAMFAFYESAVAQLAPEALYNRILWLGNRLFDDGKILYYESLSTETCTNALELYKSYGILKLVKQKRSEHLVLLPPYDSEDKLGELVKELAFLRNVPGSRGGVRATMAKDYMAYSTM